MTKKTKVEKPKIRIVHLPDSNPKRREAGTAACGATRETRIAFGHEIANVGERVHFHDACLTCRAFADAEECDDGFSLAVKS